MSRRVCLDGRSLGLRHGTGVAAYAGSLAAHLPGAGWGVDVLRDDGPPHGRTRRWLGAAWPGASHAVPAAPPAGFGHAWAAPDVFRRAQVFFDIHRRMMPVHATSGPGLVHWTYPLPLWMHGISNIYTIYDLIPLLHPALTPIAPARFGRLLRAVVRRADHIVTISEAVRADIVRHLGVDPSRITNAYVPVDVSGAGPGRVCGHFLVCGTVEPRKNIARLLAAYRESGVRAPLVLAGPDGWRAAESLAGTEIRPLEAMPDGAQGGVWRAPWLPRPALLALMRDARAVLFPSLAEGFGMPVAEAMALGVPVLTSRGGATEEVAGGAALLVDPHDTTALAAGIAALDRDADLRGRLRAAGLARAGAFSAAACAAKVAAVYEAQGS